MEIVSFQSGRVSPGIKYYTVDTEADKNNLPVGKMGNRCYVIESKKWYILNSNGEWVPFAAEGGAVDTDAILSAVENMTDAQRSQFISDLGFGTVFTFMGSVASQSDLPNSNNKVGYVYYVELDSSEYVWVVNQSHAVGYWEKLGYNSDVVTPMSIVTATGLMSQAQAAQTLGNLGGVASVNGKTGAVTLTASDVGAGTYSKPSGGIPKTDLAPAVQTSLGKADTALQSYTETDPTVPAWAKAVNKPTYTAQEVGALPDTTAIPVVPTSDINANTAARHTHSNMSVLNGITAIESTVSSTSENPVQSAAVSAAISTAVAAKANTADLATVATSGSYNDLSNKPTIPTVPTNEISANTAARHTHSNKSLLDTYAQTEVNLADAVSKKHTHNNKTVLDGITAVKLLPTVTTSDNDKFLRVVSGAWAAATVPSAETASF